MEPESDSPIHLSNSTKLASFLDANFNGWSVTRHNRNLLANLDKAIFPEELANDVQLEKVALGFWFEGCSVKREFAAVTENGEEVGTPLVNQMKSAAFDYFVRRFGQTNNPYLKARYGIILWNAPKGHKHIKYIQGAFDNLYAALSDADCSDKEGMPNCIAILRQLCAITADVKYRIKDLVAAVLERFTNEITFERKGRNQLLRLITEHSKLFRSEAPAILDTARNLFEENFEAEDFYACQHIAKQAAPFAQSIKLDVQEWHYRNGKANEGMAQERLTDDTSMMSMQFYTYAAQAYQLAGDKDAEQKALQQVEKLKDSLRLGTVSTKLPDDFGKKLEEGINLATEHLLSLESATIFRYLAFSSEIIPDYEDIRKQAEHLDNYFFLDLMSVVNIDVNKNFQREPSKTNDGAASNKIRQPYMIALKLRLQYIYRLFIDGCRTGKLSFSTLRDYLEEQSWVTQTLTKRDFNGSIIEYTWQPLLYPALGEFFKQLQIATQEAPEAPSSLVLCLDSLTLKIEGLLRELLKQTGGATIATHSKGDLREVYFDDLVDMAQQRNLLNKSEAYFFRFVFTTLGRNQRNDIAHSYYQLPEQYSFQSMILVFVAMLRLTKGRFKDAA